jgi:hypothetical protein
LAYARKGRIVDRDDPHRKRCIDMARGRPEVGIENGQPQARHWLGVCDTQRNADRQQHGGDEKNQRETVPSGIHGSGEPAI